MSADCFRTHPAILRASDSTADQSVMFFFETSHNGFVFISNFPKYFNALTALCAACVSLSVYPSIQLCPSAASFPLYIPHVPHCPTPMPPCRPPSTCVCATDASLGRFDLDSLSDEMCMELLLEHAVQLSGNVACWVRNGCATDHSHICAWKGVSCNTAQRVDRIHWNTRAYGTLALDFLPRCATHVTVHSASNVKLRGTLETPRLPSNLEALNLSNNWFSGTIATDGLPGKMRLLSVDSNRFSGGVSLETLPEHVQRATLSKNRFDGSCDLTALPAGLEALSVGTNKLTGSVSLGQLPQTLEKLVLCANAFTGEICLEKLPAGLVTLDISQNAFCGEFSLRAPPQTLQRLDASFNGFSGTAVLRRGASVALDLYATSITFVADESGKKHGKARFMGFDER